MPSLRFIPTDLLSAVRASASPASLASPAARRPRVAATLPRTKCAEASSSFWICAHSSRL